MRDYKKLIGELESDKLKISKAIEALKDLSSIETRGMSLGVVAEVKNLAFPPIDVKPIHRTGRHKKQCQNPVCGRTWIPKRQHAKFCSKACNDKAYKLEQMAKAHGTQPEVIIDAKRGRYVRNYPVSDKLCVCGKNFKSLRPWGKYCSDKCYNNARRDREQKHARAAKKEASRGTVLIPGDNLSQNRPQAS